MTHITSNVLEKIFESIDEQLIEEKSKAMAEEHLSRLMLKGYRGSDKLLTFTGSTIDDLVIDEKGASATLNAPNDKWHISIAPIHVKYFGEDLNGFQKKFDSLKPKWLEDILRQKAEEILISEKVPALISEVQLQAFKTYWRRKWSPSEKKILATMVNDGNSFGDMAKRLDRSEYVISIALRQRNRDAFNQWNIDAPKLLEIEFAEAIRCVQNSIIPKLG